MYLSRCFLHKQDSIKHISTRNYSNCCMKFLQMNSKLFCRFIIEKRTFCILRIRYEHASFFSQYTLAINKTLHFFFMIFCHWCNTNEIKNINITFDLNFFQFVIIVIKVVSQVLRKKKMNCSYFYTIQIDPFEKCSITFFFAFLQIIFILTFDIEKIGKKPHEFVQMSK